jgi:hypothetical protein
MTALKTTGLGDPEPIGKKALFRPPPARKTERITSVLNKKEKHKKITQDKPNLKSNREATNPKRVRTTIDLTAKALQIIDHVQLQHRLKTGKALPLWQAVSRAIEDYGKQ